MIDAGVAKVLQGKKSICQMQRVELGAREQIINKYFLSNLHFF